MKADKERIRQIVSNVVNEKIDFTGTASTERSPYRGGDREHRTRRELITEADVMSAHHGERALVVAPGTLFTPLARDAIDRYGVTLEEASDNAASVERVRAIASENAGCEKGTLAVGCDHGGFAMKSLLVDFLQNEAGIPCRDMGTHSEEAVDYPDFARAVAESVSRRECCRGIIIDGAGIGSAMVANKVNGVRAAHCSNVVEARNAREHNDANVLSLGGRMIGIELAKAIAVVFVKTDFAGGRHQRRVDKIMDLES